MLIINFHHVFYKSTYFQFSLIWNILILFFFSVQHYTIFFFFYLLIRKTKDRKEMFPFQFLISFLFVTFCRLSLFLFIHSFFFCLSLLLIFFLHFFTVSFHDFSLTRFFMFLSLSHLTVSLLCWFSLLFSFPSLLLTLQYLCFSLSPFTLWFSSLFLSV